MKNIVLTLGVAATLVLAACGKKEETAAPVEAPAAVAPAMPATPAATGTVAPATDGAVTTTPTEAPATTQPTEAPKQ